MDLPFQYSTRMQLYVPTLDEDVALAMEQRDIELEDYLSGLNQGAIYRHVSSTTERDAIPLSQRSVGMTVVNGDPAGTGITIPRTYVWTGAAWQIVGWWAPAGRVGCSIYTNLRAIGAGATDVSVFANEVFDYDGGAAGGTTFTVQIAGVYAVTAQDVLSTSSAGVVATTILVNGGAVAAQNGPAPFGVSTVSLTAAFTVGQTLGSSTYSANALSHTCYLHAHWLHA